MARKKRGRLIDGIFLLDKPSGITSNHALQRVKRMFNAQKAGHTGILDPMASGVLPICLGEATKFSQFLLDSDKAYKARIRFGQKTNTADADGEITETLAVDAIDRSAIEAVLPDLLGDIRQVPPMFSALKRDGQPLYKLARQGIEVERKARDICIFALDLLDFHPCEGEPWVEADVYVRCSKGTYIRTLAEDIAKAMNNVAHLTALQRVQTSSFSLDDCYSLDELEALAEAKAFSDMDQLLLLPEVAVNHLPLVEVSDETGYHVRRGQSVFVPNVFELGLVMLKQEDGTFLGVAEVQDDGRIQPRRLITDQAAQQS